MTIFQEPIFIIDDHLLFAEGIRSLLAGCGYSTVSVFPGSNGLMELLQQHRPALLLLDISMGDVDGIRLSTLIKKNYPVIKILIISMHARRVYFEKALQAGVDGYIIKNAGDEELKTAVAALLGGRKYFSAQFTDILLSSMQLTSSSVEAALTSREKDILQLLADGYSTKEIAVRLFVSVNTVETHRKNMLFKTGLRNVAHLIKWAFENGQL
jgi:DNA-binding NarL/FixJ family response regulator